MLLRYIILLLIYCSPLLLPEGDKSEVLDVDNPDPEKYPEFAKATRYECILNPGDILFIPGKTFVDE